jgi:pimeloyl-ACP methyl ester carboxylesterase
MIDRGTGIPVVLIPGLQGRWEWMGPAVDALAERCRVITFSLCDEPTSGFGFDPTRGFESYLTQIEEALDRAGVDKAMLIGVSYSGPIATAFAGRHPERVLGIVLVSALAPGWVPDRRARFYTRAPRLLTPLFYATSPLRMWPELKAAFPALGDRLRFVARQRSLVARASLSPTRMAARVRRIAAYHFDQVPRAGVPALVITGEDALDRIVPPAETRRYLGMLPGARHVVLERTGHIGSVTRPREFADLVGRFADETVQDAHRIPA